MNAAVEDHERSIRESLGLVAIAATSGIHSTSCAAINKGANRSRHVSQSKDGEEKRYTASFNSFHALNATFLLALILIASPGCRIAAHAGYAFPDLQDAKARDVDALVLF